MKSNTAIFLLLLFSKVYGQTDSLSFMLNFYPLEIGHYWEYESIAKPYNPDTTIYSVTVKSDTILSNGYRYFVIESKSLQTGEIKETRYERIDSVTSRVYCFKEDNDFIVDSLLGVSTFYEIDVDTSDYYEPWGHSYEIVEESIFGYSTYTKYVLAPIGVIDRDFKLAYGIGIVYKYGGFAPYVYTTNLLYAKINNVEYGNKVTDINNIEVIIPNKFALVQNYPNPFNPETTFNFTITNPGNIQLKIYNSLGEEILLLFNKYFTSGSHSYKHNFKNLSSGVYFYSLIAGNKKITKKMVLLK